MKNQVLIKNFPGLEQMAEWLFSLVGSKFQLEDHQASFEIANILSVSHSFHTFDNLGIVCIAVVEISEDTSVDGIFDDE